MAGEQIIFVLLKAGQHTLWLKYAISDCFDNSLQHIVKHRSTSIKQNTVQQCLVSTRHDEGDDLTFPFKMPLTESRPESQVQIINPKS